MPPTTLDLAVETSQDPKALKFEAERLICCGWVGRGNGEAPELLPYCEVVGNEWN